MITSPKSRNWLRLCEQQLPASNQLRIKTNGDRTLSIRGCYAFLVRGVCLKRTSTRSTTLCQAAETTTHINSKYIFSQRGNATIIIILFQIDGTCNDTFDITYILHLITMHQFIFLQSLLHSSMLYFPLRHDHLASFPGNFQIYLIANFSPRL